MMTCFTSVSTEAVNALLICNLADGSTQILRLPLRSPSDVYTMTVWGKIEWP